VKEMDHSILRTLKEDRLKTLRGQSAREERGLHRAKRGNDVRTVIARRGG